MAAQPGQADVDQGCGAHPCPQVVAMQQLARDEGDGEEHLQDEALLYGNAACQDTSTGAGSRQHSERCQGHTEYACKTHPSPQGVAVQQLAQDEGDGEEHPQDQALQEVVRPHHCDGHPLRSMPGLSSAAMLTTRPALAATGRHFSPLLVLCS